MGLSHDTHRATQLIPDLCRIALAFYNCGERNESAVLFARAHMQLMECVDVNWNDDWPKQTMLIAISSAEHGHTAGVRAMLEEFP